MQKYEDKHQLNSNHGKIRLTYAYGCIKTIWILVQDVTLYALNTDFIFFWYK